MSRILRWRCRLPGDRNGPLWPMVCVDEQTEAEYALYGDLEQYKTYIYHDGSPQGRAQADAIALCLAAEGEAVRDLGQPGIVAIYSHYHGHRIYERRGHLAVVAEARRAA
jgi:hypothetical protein